ncbi:hypothetical protein LZK82_26610 (plasmid) [Rhizobium leguminosarum]|uniref:putative metallopeptidase n=1 Tax=Rhizobium leguminosarum TaxID=384 RepID=UPI001FD87B1F|nr:putative metallopeptidase [Rhizobium leguminosarum]UIK01498.1 hypothetical protein LZK82_26610 [Rhizobium leguminosarum]UIK14392.1 hypothetical protein LZK80_32250 [Rhizobium leguminosarum]UIL30516.1 hypothetical protein LZK75_26955 [Rhizobium leguminosarum]WFT89599.1 putative metallopeptidase [Rhizobium leguminosarum]
MSASDAQACALMEHELSHCAQELDDFGAPKFPKRWMHPKPPTMPGPQKPKTAYFCAIAMSRWQ